MKRLTAFCAVLALFFCVFPASAEEWDDWGNDGYVWEDVLGEMDLRRDTVTGADLNAARGTVYEVLSAPFDDAWHPAGGKARVSVNEPFTLLGTAENGRWSMIEYSISGGAKRIGWARLPNIRPGYNGLFPTYDARLCALTRDVSLTDDPNGKAAAAVKMRAGDTVVAMGTMGKWAYVRTLIDGRTAWLFTEADALSPLDCWTIDENGVLTVREGVTRIGGAHLDWTDDEDDPSVMAPLRSDEITAPSLIKGENVPFGVRAVVFPASLRVLGSEAVVYGHYESITLPNLKDGTGWDAFYALRIDRLILSADCADIDALSKGDYVTVGAFEVEEGNPFFKAVDGVLFSADGKKLIAYPNGAEAEHYTVPAGVEEIGAGAFYDSMMSYPLKTISLPIGLKKIGDCAFAGCGRLISLVVPLTVTELGENAFWFCVSLERLSLPPGLDAVFNGDWAEQGDFTYFNGDNGTTDTEPPPVWEDG